MEIYFSNQMVQRRHPDIEINLALAVIDPLVELLVKVRSLNLNDYYC